MNFACLSGDFNEVHTNPSTARPRQFGEPIAHGPLIYAIMGGLQYASGVNDGTLLALLQIDGWRMLNPVKHGDTIRMRSRVIEKKETSKPDRGVVTFERQCIKQDGTRCPGDEGDADAAGAPRLSRRPVDPAIARPG